MLLIRYSSMKKKNEKDSNDFLHRKLTLKVIFWAFFDSSPLILNSKFNNFLWVCLFLGKNLSNFVPPVWKLHNPYCHIIHRPSLGRGGRRRIWIRWMKSGDGPRLAYRVASRWRCWVLSFVESLWLSLYHTSLLDMKWNWITIEVPSLQLSTL